MITNSVSNSDPISSLGLGVPQAENKNNELGQDDFMTLMLAQLKSQDPLKPMENGEFIAQMAQFSTVSGVQELNEAFAGLSNALQVNQGLQAASLVGRSAMVEADTLEHDGESTQQGAVGLTASAADVRIQITDSSGSLIREINIGDQGAGLADFEWDGLNDEGQAVPAGNYQFTAVAQNGDSPIALPTYLAGEVGSVTLNSSGSAYLELQGLGTVAFGDIRQIL